MNTEKTILAVGVVGAIAIGGYFIYQSTSQPTDQTGSDCAGDWTDYFNPLCWASGLGASVSNAADQATNEINTVLIIVAVFIVVIVGLLAFGPQTGTLAGAVVPRL
jgi:predicted permease